ncbi:amino acid adenylation domain-containing protein [Sulfurimonas aquatica]|uniref:Amino acid adenylation domain-containing protein n=1 Tax=Sulfurimonas aquatica TaxID=2672570 RepID=A0A975GCE8_9BACT|nr:amino acid adenylation domain-containing protein [Sulfurimonas aquatica]QSZ41228.1 amino acid adenylation domain-containing protein [Sulfurimonas aquatica]
MITENIFDNDICEIFVQQVKKNNYKTAVVFKNEYLTYKELNDKSNSLACYIKKYMLENKNIALFLERSLELPLSILSIFKAGGTYIPVDPNFSDVRIKFILNDTSTHIVITQKKFSKKLRLINKNITIIEIDDFSYNKSINPINLKKKNNIAYIIYTSGTTGNPKGVMINHSSLLNRLLWMKNKFNIAQNQVILHKTPYTFDVSVWELLLSFLTGSTLVISNPEDHKDPLKIVNNIINYNINIIHFVPSMFLYFLEYLQVQPHKNIDIILHNLDYIFTSGEVLQKHHVNLFNKINKYKKTKLINLYGPTETTIDSTYFDCSNNIHSIIPIGKAIDNTKVYILSDALKAVKKGEVGELYISGIGLAEGYNNQEKLTKTSFLQNIFIKENESEIYNKMYKTGDLVRLLDDDNLQYIGRTDSQVKINGLRIELEEIELNLRKFSLIFETKVILYKNSYLIAYYQSELPINSNKLKSFLQNRLPEYMIPYLFIHVISFPTTLHGKLDFKSFPKPIFYSHENYVAPTNNLESSLCEIFQKILNRPKVGINDDFFSIGGDSLLSISLTLEIEITLNISIKLQNIFLSKTVKKLAHQISLQKYKKGKEMLISNLNNYSNTKKNMYMIHPGNASCEAYQEFATNIDSSYNCIGIDNYNLYHSEKISSLKQLATYYLKIILNDNLFNKDEINLYGWSLGGLIALEIAAQLEKKSYVNINVYAIDTFILDDRLKDIISKMDIEKRKENLRKSYIAAGFEVSYVNKVISAYNAEFILSQAERLSSMLVSSNIILFKALEKNLNWKGTDNEDLYDYIISLKNNNLDKIGENINIIPVNFHHGDIKKASHVLKDFFTE